MRVRACVTDAVRCVRLRVVTTGAAGDIPFKCSRSVDPWFAASSRHVAAAALVGAGTSQQPVVRVPAALLISALCEQNNDGLSRFGKPVDGGSQVCEAPLAPLLPLSSHAIKINWCWWHNKPHPLSASHHKSLAIQWHTRLLRGEFRESVMELLPLHPPLLVASRHLLYWS
jgi:hypothetical protein